MQYKIVARMVQHTADADPDKCWMSTYLGVIDAEISGQMNSSPMLAAKVPAYRMMCSAIGEMGERALIWCLAEIRNIEEGETEEVDSSTEGFEFLLRKDRPISFEFLYGEKGIERSGEVTLSQFKLAVQTYFQFLRDPERKPFEVPFSTA